VIVRFQFGGTVAKDREITKRKKEREREGTKGNIKSYSKNGRFA
jgi:hypothetical protein